MGSRLTKNDNNDTARRGSKNLFVTLALLTATSLQAQTTPAIGNGIDAQDGRRMSKHHNEVMAHTVSSTTDAAPKITITADRDTIFGGLEDMRLVLTRENPGKELTVKLRLQQDEDWLNRSTRSRSVYFYPNDTIAVLKVHKSQFDADVTRSGCIIVKVVEAKGYNIDKAKAPVWVISSPDPLVTLFVSREVFTVGENAGRLSGARVFATMAPGMPRGVSLTASLDTRGKGSEPELTATSGEDYESPRKALVIQESSFAPSRGNWIGSAEFVLPILDDDLREGDEVFEVILEVDSELSGLVRYRESILGKKCRSECVHRVRITDEEDTPALDLSVSADEIMEEGETSSTAMVSATNRKSFAADQLVTLSLDGTATMGTDYTVSPADADEGTRGFQVILPGESTSTEVTIKAMSDNVDDPNETIEVSAALDGDAIGDMQVVRIMNQEMPLPKISVAANRPTIIGSMENLVLTLTREEPLSERLTVTVQLAQERDWLPWTSCPVTFEAGAATASVTIPHSAFSTNVVASGDLTMTVNAVDGYDTDDARATVYVVSQEGPAVRVFFDQDSYRFGEDRKDATADLIVEAAPGMPRGTTVAFSMFSESGTAKANEDFKAVSRQMTIREEDFSFRNGSWQVRRRLPVTLIDDEIREGDETCDLVLESARDAQADLALAAVTPVDITDDEDIPEMNLRLSADEIEEKGETSSTATVSITNGKIFATDQLVTFKLGGTATRGEDYKVSPRDADESASDHQVELPAGSRSVEMMFTAQDDDIRDPDEEITVSVAHDGHAIDNRSIRIRDRQRGPTLEVTFEGVRSVHDAHIAGIATGPFTTRIVFSERVAGFAEEIISWQTHAGTTEDGTNIGLLPWDFTEVRAGVEYTVEMMPTQNGEVHIGVQAGAVTSVATGAGNEWGLNRLRIELPKDRMLVAPTEVAVYEGGTDEGDFIVVLTSEPTSDVTIAVSGMEGTAVAVDRPTITIKRRFWRVGSVVSVTAGDDANVTNEAVTLKVSPSGGGYDGRDADVVVTVKDDDAAYARGMSADEALTLVDDVTAEEAAAALFGEGDLSDAQLDALDLLGNGNGRYDLGDLLSWIERSRQGATSRGAVSVGLVAGAIAVLPAGGVGGQRGGTSQQGRGSRGSAARRRTRVRRILRRPGRSWYGLVLMLLVTLTWACADDVVQPSATEPDPGFLTVQLTAPPSARDLGALLVVEGPGIESVRSPGFELFQSETISPRQIIVAGALSTGPIVQFQVPDRGLHTLYRVRLLQVTGEDHSLRDLSAYRAEILR